MPSDQFKSGLVCVDLFAGAGGLSLGLRQAGFSVALAVEFEQYCCESYEKNLGNHILRTDVAGLSVRTIRRKTSNRPISLVCGGPPCQGFSLQRRGPRADARNDLTREFFDLALQLQPAFILMENVPAILGLRGRFCIDSVAEMIKEKGYEMTSAVLNAADYGVPQHRRRAFIAAWNTDARFDFRFPTPLPRKYRTVRDAISDIPEPPDDYSEHPDFSNHRKARITPMNELRISHVPEGGGRLDIPRELQLPCHKNGNGHRHLDVYGRMEWDSPAPTITALSDNFTRGRFAHPEENRAITAREAARLQSFPDTFHFVGPKKDVARQIGNAVPPLLAQHIGAAVLASLGVRDDKLGAHADRQIRLAFTPRK